MAMLFAGDRPMPSHFAPVERLGLHDRLAAYYEIFVLLGQLLDLIHHEREGTIPVLARVTGGGF